MRVPRALPTAARLAAALLTTPLLVAALSTTAGAQTSSAPPRLRAGDIDTMPVREPGIRVPYGSDSLQFGELRLPAGRGPFPVVVVLHGGCWVSRYATLRNTAPLAQALTDAGVATWNVEYRRYDHPGGGWPGTFRDAAEALDHVRVLARRYPLDTTRIVATGHSAGGHLAAWLATRGSLAPTSALRIPGTPVALAGVVTIGAILDLPAFYARERQTCGNPAVESLLGGVPDSVPDRVREASPIVRVPLGVPSTHVAGGRDAIAPAATLEAFAAAARAAGDSVVVTIVPGEGHFEAIAPGRATARAVIDAILALTFTGRPGRANLHERRGRQSAPAFVLFRSPP